MSEKEKILITGSTGFLGSAISEKLKDQYEIIYGFNKSKKIKNKKKIKINIKNFLYIKNFIKTENINVIIHCAGITDVDYCEKNKNECLDVNYKITKRLVDIALLYSIRFIFISSDHLFSGNKKLYKETDKLYPLNNYAKSKVESEKYIKKKLSNFVIIRTNFFGNHVMNKKSFFRFIYKNLKKKRKIFLFKDVKFSPLFVFTVASLMKKIIKKKLIGIFNFSSDNSLSKYDFGLLVASIFRLNKKLIIASEIKNMNLTRRPKNMSLSNLKLRKTLNIKQKMTVRSEILKLKKTNMIRI